jgi:hypothetical protein
VQAFAIPRDHTSKPRPETSAITAALAASFEAEHIVYLPASVSGQRVLARAAVDVQAIQDRLDEVVGVEGWQDDYECLPNGAVVCRLRLRLGGAWVAKSDVGRAEAASSLDDPLRNSFHIAFQRAAQKFGIGRYLDDWSPEWNDRGFLGAIPVPQTLRGEAPAVSGGKASTPEQPRRLKSVA